MNIKKRRTAALLLLSFIFTFVYFYLEGQDSEHGTPSRSYSNAFAKGHLGDLNPALFFKGEQKVTQHRPRPTSALRLKNDYNDNVEVVYDRDVEKDETEDEDEDENYDEEEEELVEGEEELEGEEEEEEERDVIPAQEPDDSHASRLVVVAYMRTGSTMTGKILDLSPDVFYWYEPLHSLERYYVTGGHPESSYRNKTMNEMFKDSDMASGNVSATLSCDIAHVYNGSLLDYFMRFSKQGTGRFHDCFMNAKNSDQWVQCENNMTQYCRSKFKVTAVKTIRLHMARALEVMRRDPKVKVVHLVRDPRGVLLSRKKVGFADFDRLEAEAKLLCGKLKEDIERIPPPGHPLRSRYTLVRYEDIAAVPLQHTKQLYDVMGLTPSDDILRKVKDMTETATKRKPCSGCKPVMLNSTEVSQAWRNTLTLEQVHTISNACADVMALLGYRVTFDSEAQLRDLGVSAVGLVKVK